MNFLKKFTSFISFVPSIIVSLINRFTNQKESTNYKQTIPSRRVKTQLSNREEQLKRSQEQIKLTQAVEPVKHKIENLLVNKEEPMDLGTASLGLKALQKSILRTLVKGDLMTTTEALNFVTSEDFQYFEEVLLFKYNDPRTLWYNEENNFSENVDYKAAADKIMNVITEYSSNKEKFNALYEQLKERRKERNRQKHEEQLNEKQQVLENEVKEATQKELDANKILQNEKPVDKFEEVSPLDYFLKDNPEIQNANIQTNEEASKLNGTQKLTDLFDL